MASMDKVPIHLSLDEVGVSVGHEVLMEADGNCTLVIGNAQRISGCQLRLRPMQIFNIAIIILITFQV